VTVVSQFAVSRRALEASRPGFEEHAYVHWEAKRLGEEFGSRVCEAAKTEETTVLPLLHVSIARGRYLERHRDFCAGHSPNYFDCVGCALAECLLGCKNQPAHLFIR